MSDPSDQTPIDDQKLLDDAIPIDAIEEEDGAEEKTAAELPEAIELEGGDELSGPVQEIKTFGRENLHEDEWARTPNTTGNGAIHVRRRGASGPAD